MDDDAMTLNDASEIDLLQVGDVPSLERVMAAQQGVVDSEMELRLAVGAAREAGNSWKDIGVALGTSRSNAYQRFARRG